MSLSLALRSYGEDLSLSVLTKESSLRRLAARGGLTSRECAALTAPGVRPAERPMVVIGWVASRLTAARRAGVLTGGERLLLTKARARARDIAPARRTAPSRPSRG